MLKRNFLVLTLAIFCFSFHPAYAGELTRDSIENFINEFSSLTDQNNGMSDEDVNSFLEKHLASNGKYQGNIIYDIPGYPPQTKQADMNKSDFIATALQGRNTIKDHSARVRINHIKIESGDQRATIRTRTDETGLMPVLDETPVPFKGLSTCTQTITLHADNIMLDSAQCQTVITFIEE